MVPSAPLLCHTQHQLFLEKPNAVASFDSLPVSFTRSRADSVFVVYLFVSVSVPNILASALPQGGGDIVAD